MFQKIKIVFFLGTLNAGGAEKVTLTQIRQLDSQKFDIYLILVNKVGSFLNLVPSYVNVIDLNKRKTIFSIFSLRKCLKEIQADIIYSTLLRTHIAVDFALKTFLHGKVKTIYRSPSSPKTLFERGEVSFVMKYLIHKAYSNAYMVLAQTPEMKEEIHLYHKVEKDKIKTFLNPIDTDDIDLKVKNSINPFDPNKINIVAAGRLSNVKGFDVLIDALDDVLKKNNKYLLHIIGRDGGEEKYLKMKVDNLGISKYINFLGYQENPFKFFIHSDLFVLSSRREGLPNVVLENIYLNKPIIATKCIP
ncbi:MAG TPA: glycosyltransferase, partial [Flavobacteriia bacterium]|nr:glycosyltransferase [Flavobacteriia bacterium]